MKILTNNIPIDRKKKIFKLYYIFNELNFENHIYWKWRFLTYITTTNNSIHFIENEIDNLIYINEIKLCCYEKNINAINSSIQGLIEKKLIAKPESLNYSLSISPQHYNVISFYGLTFRFCITDEKVDFFPLLTNSNTQIRKLIKEYIIENSLIT